MISVLMGVKTGWQYFPEAYASLCTQQHVEWELFVGVNGQQSDSAVHATIMGQINWSLDNAYVLDLNTCTNKPQALNLMVDLSHGSHVAILDVDDMWHPWKLAKQLAYLRDYDVVGTMGEYFGTSEGPIDIPSGPVTFDALLEKNCILNSSVIIRRELAKWPNTDGLDDYRMWLELAFHGKRLRNIGGEPLVKIRCHGEQHFGGARDDSNAIREEYRQRAAR